MMKFVMTQAVCPEGLELLKGRADWYVADNGNPHEYLDKMRDADALIVRIASCDGKVIENSPNLKVIGRTGVGYDSVDVVKATEMGIPVVLTPGANTRSVAEHAVAMMFALAKNFYEAQTEMAKGNWKIRDAKKASELEWKTVGIVGFGNIGKATGRLCEAIGMKLVAYDPVLSQEQVEALGATYCASLDELLPQSDFVSIHVPLVRETENLISRRELGLMKRTAFIINCSRGGIINEVDLVDALKEGRIAGAGLDVYCEEPPAPGNPLFGCPGLLLSPHSAAQTREAVIKMAKMCVEGCLAVCEGKKWPYVADKNVYCHPKWKGKDWAF